MKKYSITYTYQNVIEAKDENEALEKIDNEIVNGDLEPEIDIIEKGGSNNER